MFADELSSIDLSCKSRPVSSVGSTEEECVSTDTTHTIALPLYSGALADGSQPRVATDPPVTFEHRMDQHGGATALIAFAQPDCYGFTDVRAWANELPISPLVAATKRSVGS